MARPRICRVREFDIVIALSFFHTKQGNQQIVDFAIAPIPVRNLLLLYTTAKSKTVAPAGKYAKKFMTRYLQGGSKK